jgi:stage II sporulation protein AB (anti-sigma F factor)
LYKGNIVRISVRDRGCGIPDVKKARLPLYTTDAENERSGMGFTVMENFMDKLVVSSRVGKGTTVVMYKTIKPTLLSDL